MPIHITANRGDIAERVVVVGDPARARQLKGLLQDARLVNENRGFLTYTGKYNGVDITVATHGIGAPSLAIVVEELYSLGARFIVRLGTVGSLRGDINLRDIIVPTAAGYNQGGIYQQYVGNLGISYPAVPDLELTNTILSELKNEGVKVHLGIVYSSDAFYAESGIVDLLRSRGFIGIEMECAALFILGNIRGFKAAAALIVSNKLTEQSPFLGSPELQETVIRVGKAILNALVKMH